MTAHASNPINIREPHPVGTSFLFRALRDDECELGYSFIAGASAWLSGKGIRMWERPLPLSTYLQRQQRGENYGLFVDDRLTAIASIIDIPVDWQQDIDDIRAKWLSTLAVSPSDHGNGIGREAIVQISIMLAARDCRDLYLDCSPRFSFGLLPSVRLRMCYYSKENNQPSARTRVRS